MSDANAWRMKQARRLAAVFASETDVAEVSAIGSTARGRADRFSDLDVFVLWDEAPTDGERMRAVSGCGADLVTLYEYDPDVWCWSDAYTLGRDASGAVHTGLAVDVAHFLLSDVKRAIAAIVDGSATDDASHNVAKLVPWSVALHGAPLVDELIRAHGVGP